MSPHPVLNETDIHREPVSNETDIHREPVSNETDIDRGSVWSEANVYREFRPPGTLRGAVACFWVRRGDGSETRVLPDACADIVWRAGQVAVVAGPDTRAWQSQTRPGELIVGARLLPGAGGAALGLPLAELRDQRVPLPELSDQRMPLPELRDQRVQLPELWLDAEWRLAGDADPTAALVSLARITTSLVADRPPDPAVQAAVVRLLDPAQRVETLAADLGFSERQLRRRFHVAVGYGPKMLQRVLRLRRFIAHGAAGDSELHLASAALEAGYSDQPHLGRECRELTGLSPRELISCARAG